MTTDFNVFDINEHLVQTIIQQGFTTPMPIQASVIPALLAGKDVIGQAQTGSGKTAAFAVPIIERSIPQAGYIQNLILAPTRELAIQVASAIQTFSSHIPLRVLAVYGGQSYNTQVAPLRKGVDIVVGTPGRLLDLINKKVLDISKVRTVILDEADEMLSMGFIEDIEAILAVTPQQRQTALFSATLSPEIRRLAGKYLVDPEFIQSNSEHMTVESIEQRYYLVHKNDKMAAILRLLEAEQTTSALIFVRTRSATSELADSLSAYGFPAEALNGDLSQDTRERVLNRFRNSSIQILVATDVAARGLDIDGISHVINYDLPEDPEIYVHRIGRTGRAGKTGIAISLITPAEKRRLRQIESFTKKKLNLIEMPSEEDIQKQRETRLVNKVMVWLKRGRYLREKELIEALVSEGHDLLEIAAASLKMARTIEKQTPVLKLTNVSEFKTENDFQRKRTSQGEKYRVISKRSHENGMIRLSMNLGKTHGIRPNDIVGAIASKAEIPGKEIGKILIQDSHSFVDVPEYLVSKVLGKSSGMLIHRHSMQLKLARSEN